MNIAVKTRTMRVRQTRLRSSGTCAVPVDECRRRLCPYRPLRRAWSSALADLISRQREPGTEVLRFPPVMSRAHAGEVRLPQELSASSRLCELPAGQRSGRSAPWSTISSRPRLGAGAGRRRSRAEPGSLLSRLSARRQPRPGAGGGLLFDVACDCFRREPSRHLDRLQSFRMREYVCIGSPEQIDGFRKRWMTRAKGIADQLGLPYRVDQASDPFFGRGGKLMADGADRTVLEVRIADSHALGRAADGLHEFQLPPRSFRHDLGLADRARRRLPTPGVSPSAWIGSR